MTSQVSVTLRRDPEHVGVLMFVVKVSSEVRPGLGATIPVGMKNRTGAEIQTLVGVAAAAGAEYLGENYGDTFDPADAEAAAKKAMAAEAFTYATICRNQRAWAIKTASLVDRLKQMNLNPDNAKTYPDWEELYQRAHLIKHISNTQGLPLTPEEMMFISSTDKRTTC